jgi:hypothetical protein
MASIKDLHRRRGYSQRGQGILEAVVGVVLFTFIAVALIFVILNIGQYLLYQQRINDIADKAVVNGKCELVWNNAMRPRASIENAEQACSRAAGQLLRAYGLPEPDNLRLSVEGDMLRLDFDVNGLAMPNGGLCYLPALVNSHASGRFVIPRESPPCYLTVTIDNDLSRSMVIPAYGPHGGDDTTNAQALKNRLTQGISGYARLLNNRQDYYGICQIDHAGDTATYKYDKYTSN